MSAQPCCGSLLFLSCPPGTAHTIACEHTIAGQPAQLGCCGWLRWQQKRSCGTSFATPLCRSQCTPPDLVLVCGRIGNRILGGHCSAARGYKGRGRHVAPLHHLYFSFQLYIFAHSLLFHLPPPCHNMDPHYQRFYAQFPELAYSANSPAQMQHPLTMQGLAGTNLLGRVTGNTRYGGAASRGTQQRYSPRSRDASGLNSSGSNSAGHGHQKPSKSQCSSGNNELHSARHGKHRSKESESDRHHHRSSREHSNQRSSSSSSSGGSTALAVIGGLAASFLGLKLLSSSKSHSGRERDFNVCGNLFEECDQFVKWEQAKKASE